MKKLLPSLLLAVCLSSAAQPSVTIDPALDGAAFAPGSEFAFTIEAADVAALQAFAVPDADASLRFDADVSEAIPGLFIGLLSLDDPGRYTVFARSAADAAVLDSARVMIVPEPASVSLLAAAGLLLLRRTR